MQPESRQDGYLLGRSLVRLSDRHSSLGLGHLGLEQAIIEFHQHLPGRYRVPFASVEAHDLPPKLGNNADRFALHGPGGNQDIGSLLSFCLSTNPGDKLLRTASLQASVNQELCDLLGDRRAHHQPPTRAAPRITAAKR